MHTLSLPPTPTPWENLAMVDRILPENLDSFEEQRPGLERLAYRMLGSRADADDILQEAFVRWAREDRHTIDSPRAYLTSVVTRLCIDRKREIDARKETYVGTWLPEPILERAGGAAADRPAELSESISMAFLYVLERLSPVERAAYLLRQVFGYDYAEISTILEKSEENCRQIVSRAERRVHEGRPRFDAPSAEVSRLSQEFLQACATGDLQGLLRLLADDVVVISDGGGKATAALRPIEGPDHVARFFLGIFRKSPAYGRAEQVVVNGQPGLAAYLHDELVSLFSLDIVDGRIQGIYVMRNPDKLPRPS